MSSAADRAEARRKAILARGSSRLAKLTTSARGEDSPVYVHDDPPLAPTPEVPSAKEFVGEETRLPTPPAPRSRVTSDSRPPSLTSAGLGNVQPDPSVWSEEQQQQLLNALMGGIGRGSNASVPPDLSNLLSPPPNTDTRNANANGPTSRESPVPEDPLSMMMAAFAQQQKDGGKNPFVSMPTMEAPPPPTPKTLLQKVTPLVHFVAAWILLAYFIIWREPEAYDVRTHGSTLARGLWKRWAELGWQSPEDGWGVQTMPFFWAFTTLAIVLHSWRIFFGVDPVQPPMFLSFILPHLPSPIPSLVVNGIKYLQIGSVFLDDVAGLLVATGLLIWIASWVVG